LNKSIAIALHHFVFAFAFLSSEPGTFFYIASGVLFWIVSLIVMCKIGMDVYLQFMDIE
jgi:hypothetical protein